MILYVTNVDTEVLALRTAIEALPDGFGPVRAAQPWTVDGVPDLTGVRCVLVRLLRGRHAWPEGFDALQEECARRAVAFLAFAGEAVPDPDLTARSSVPSGIVTEAFAYLVNGGPQNFEQLLIVRGLQGFGFGGEWAAGSVLIAEVVRAQDRGDCSGADHTAFLCHFTKREENLRPACQSLRIRL